MIFAAKNLGFGFRSLKVAQKNSDLDLGDQKKGKILHFGQNDENPGKISLQNPNPQNFRRLLVS